MYRLLFKSFLRSKTVVTALLLFLCMGMISIFIGKQFLERQDKAIQATTAFQKEHIERNARYIESEFGLLMYYLRFSFINKPDPMAALSIGQRDVNPSIQSLTIRGLEGQRYDTDLYNPYNLLTGNLDLSFFIIFLLPLLIIAFNFNIVSQEKEGGTWALVNVQSRQPAGFIWQKLSVRYLTVVGLLTTLLILAKMILALPVDQQFLAFGTTALLYVTTWFAISYLVIAFKKGTATNALLLLSVWVLLCLLVPALVNSYITSRYTVPEAYSAMIKQRDGYHTKWDVPADSSIDKFYKRYPEYAQFTWNRPSFNYLWYYAMQQLGDDEAAADSRSMFAKLRQRQTVSETAALLFPSMHAQLQFTEISQTGLSHHLDFLDSTGRFHEKLRHYFYPKIFGGTRASEENWAKHVPVYFDTVQQINWGKITFPFVLMSMLLIVAGTWVFKSRV